MPRGTRKRYFKRKNTRTKQKIRKQRRTKKSGNTRKRKQRRTRRRRRGGDDDEEARPPDPSEEQVMANRMVRPVPLRSWTSFWNNGTYYWISIPSKGELTDWFPLTEENRDGRDELALDADYVDEDDRRKFLEELTEEQKKWAKYRKLPGEASEEAVAAARKRRAEVLAAKGVQRTKSGIKDLLPLHVAYPLNPSIAIPADQPPPRAAAAMSVQGQGRWVPDLSEAVQMAEGGGGVAEAVPGPVLSAAGVRRLQKDR